MMGYGGWGMGAGGPIGMILFWIVAILAVAWLLRSFDVGTAWSGRRERRTPDTHDTHAPDPALSILRERYARGEIDADELERRKQDLARAHTP